MVSKTFILIAAFATLAIVIQLVFSDKTGGSGGSGGSGGCTGANCGGAGGGSGGCTGGNCGGSGGCQGGNCGGAGGCAGGNCGGAGGCSPMMMCDKGQKYANNVLAKYINNCGSGGQGVCGAVSKCGKYKNYQMVCGGAMNCQNCNPYAFNKYWKCMSMTMSKQQWNMYVKNQGGCSQNSG